MTMENKRYDNVGELLLSTVLPNGLRVLVVPKPDYERTFAMFATNYGGAMRRFRLDGKMVDTPAGVAHFLEHKMFDMPDGTDVMAEFSRAGAAPNAFTAAGMTAYFFDCTENFEKNLRLLVRYVSTPCFTPESVAKEQGIIGQEIRMIEDSPGYAVYIALLRALYARHPLRDGVAGSIESIAEITDETLMSCWQAFYRPSNMTLCVVGKAEAEAVAEIAEELLPGGAKPAPEPVFGEPDGLMPTESVTRRAMEVSAPQFLVGAKIAPAEHGSAFLRQKLVGSLALRCLMGRSSKFYTGLYAEGLLKGDFDCEIDYAAGTATFIAGGESRAPERVLERLSSEAARICAQGVGRERFENARRAMWGARLGGLEDFDDLAAELCRGSFGGCCPLDAFGMIKDISEEECAGFIKEHLAPERLALSVADPVKGASDVNNDA